MPRAVLIALGAGALSALFYLAVRLGSFGAIILAYLAQLPLFAVGLSLGFPSVLIASGIGFAIVLVSLPLSAAGLFALTTALPVLVLVNRALLSRPAPDGSVEWYPTGYLLAILCVLALVVLAAAAVLLSGHEGGMVGAGRKLLDEMMQGLSGAGTAAEDVAQSEATIVRLLPAVVLLSWQVMVIVNGLLAQGALSRFGKNLRPGAPFAELFLPPWMSGILAGSIIAAFVPGQIGSFGLNAAIVAAVPFLFLGLSVIHAVSKTWPARGLVLFLIYLILVIVGWPAVIVAAIGVVEPWIGLRQRLGPPRDDNEEE